MACYQSELHRTPVKKKGTGETERELTLLNFLMLSH